MPPSQDARQRLVQAALKLFATRGYHNTSISDILKESGCTRGLLYYYFSSKEELGYAAIDEQIRLLFQQGAASHLQTSEHPIDRLLEVLDDMPNRVRLAPAGELVIGVSASMACVHPGFRQRLLTSLAPVVDEIEQMLRKGIADGQIVDSIDPRQVAHVLVILGHGIQMAALLGQDEVISEDARRWIRDFLNSLRK
jgi:AcrR family transcriptional regulator